MGILFSSNVSGQPNGTWNNEVGYGRINGCQAALGAFEATMAITGPTLVCTSASQFTLNNAPVGAAVTWTATPANLFAVSSGTGSNATLSAENSEVSGQGTITFSISNSCGPHLSQVSKVIWAGKPQPTIDMSYNFSGTVPLEICASPGYPGEFYTYINPNSTEYFEWESDAGDFLYPNPSYQFNGNYTTSNYVYFPNWIGSYPTRTIRIRALNSCGESSWNTRYFDLIVSNDCQGGGMGLSMAPNPSSDYFDVTLEGVDPAKEQLDFEYYLEIIDPMGNVRKALTTDKRVTRITVNNFSKGIYYAKAHLKGNQIVRRILIE